MEKSILDNSNKNIWKQFFLISLLFSVFVLSVAFFIDYFLDYEPCILCIYQRIPYFLTILVSIIAMFLRKYHWLFFSLIFILVIAEGSIAVYHTGVEHGIWSPTESCASDVIVSDKTDITNFLEQVNNMPLSDCRKPAFKILSFSLAEINVVLSFFLLIILSIFGYRNAKA